MLVVRVTAARGVANDIRTAHRVDLGIAVRGGPGLIAADFDHLVRRTLDEQGSIAREDELVRNDAIVVAGHHTVAHVDLDGSEGLVRRKLTAGQHIGRGDIAGGQDEENGSEGAGHWNLQRIHGCTNMRRTS